MANTTNLNLVKPAGTDHALISDINGNMDIIDAAIGALPSGSSLQGEINSLDDSITALDANANVYIGEIVKTVSIPRTSAGLQTVAVSNLAIPTKSGYTFLKWIVTCGTAVIPLLSCSSVNNPTLLYYVTTVYNTNANVDFRPMFIRS